ncbi:MAG: hypothetical protein AABX05_05325 [Nanoarchaeota archaeon]
MKVSPPPHFIMVHLATEKDKYCCKKCKSMHVDIYTDGSEKYQACLDCGYEEKLKS